MTAVRAKSVAETVVIAQIEEPEGVAEAAEIAAVPGIDGLFIGPSDLTIAMGLETPADPKLATAMADVGAATKAAGKTYVTWVSGPAQAAEWQKHGFSMFFVSSEHAWMKAGAAAVAEGIHDLA